MNPLLVGPRLALRALDDLHAIARAATRVDALLDAADRIERMGERLLGLGERIDGRVEALLALGEGIDGRADALLSLGERLDDRGQEIVRLGERMDGLGRDLLGQGRNIEASAEEVSIRAAEILAALPLLERAVGIATPLEGAVERLGRAVDRLPGGRGLRPRGPATPD